MVCLSCSNSFLIMRCRRTSEAWSAARIRTMRVHHIFLRMEKTKNHQSQKNRHVFDLRMTHLLSGIFWWLIYHWKAHLLWYMAICITPIGPLTVFLQFWSGQSYLYMLQNFWGHRVPQQRMYQVLGLLYFSYIQEANLEEINAQGVHQKKTLHDNPSSQMLLAHPRMRLQSSPFAIIYLIVLLFFSQEENSQ